MGAENAIVLSAVIGPERIEIARGPHNRPATLPQRAEVPISATLSGSTVPVTAFFRSEAAALRPHFVEQGEDAQASSAIVLSGHVTQVSYPGGTWRHTVKVGEQEFFVDAPVRYTPAHPVQVHLPAGAVFLFPALTDPELTDGRAADAGTAALAKTTKQAVGMN
jgi:hypothetical protein